MVPFLFSFNPVVITNQVVAQVDGGAAMFNASVIIITNAYLFNKKIFLTFIFLSTVTNYYMFFLHFFF